MSSARKLLKIVSFIQVILAVVTVVLGVMGASGAGSATGEVNLLVIALEASVAATIGGVLAIVLGVALFASAAMGVRGANRPSALGSHMAISALCVILGIIGAFICLNANAMPAAVCCAFDAVLGVLAALYDSKVKKELDR
ncbi:hypothetical protein [Enorma phocaeensis]|uniref:DUF2975 domain-containing protein n=1 Tax=Enorma phocaeensis TaxID=1871019 RepID=A0ABT7V8V8_9ACTN|nr:hypothetical protein [Enorma phocaeensis]MDM8274942.1 hypothetical protein [Enorma phocaeensis]